MPSSPVTTEQHTPQDERLAEALAALAYPVRIAMLRQLREPKALKEIRVAPASPGSGRADRPMSRQAVKEHLETLVEAGAVVTREADREFGTTVEYVVSHRSLYAISEEFRELAQLKPKELPEEDTMLGSQAGEERHELDGPCLLLVKGIDEGRTYDLDPASTSGAPWLIGRSSNLDVPLDFDPFVSSENTRIDHEEGAYFVEDLPASRNGTTLNFDKLQDGSKEELQHGDLIGVGRSLLQFRA